MMNELLLNREIQDEATIGRLLWGSDFLYYTLEPPAPSTDNKGCIPEGRYQIQMQWSPRFQREMPHLQNVPNFEGILIHWGNYVKDTEGCILIGLGETQTTITQSKAAFADFVPKLEQALLQGEVWITIK